MLNPHSKSNTSTDRDGLLLTRVLSKERPNFSKCNFSNESESFFQSGTDRYTCRPKTYVSFFEFEFWKIEESKLVYIVGDINFDSVKSILTKSQF